jgi:hypothetical protein
MNTAGIIMIGIALGITSVFAYGYTSQAIKTRLNYGQKVRFENEVIGHISVCRYHGVKKYFFTTKNFGPLNPTSFYERQDAISACRKAHLDEMLKEQAERPKQTSVPRVA